MQPILFDTSVYIAAFRSKEDKSVELRRMAGGAPIWLSAVVLEELYAGADARATRALARLDRDFDRARRILVPNLKDWAQAGKALARLAVRYDYENIGLGRLTNDALIAASAARLGITVCTLNAADFTRLSEFLPFKFIVQPL